MGVQKVHRRGGSDTSQAGGCKTSGSHASAAHRILIILVFTIVLFFLFGLWGLALALQLLQPLRLCLICIGGAQLKEAKIRYTAIAEAW